MPSVTVKAKSVPLWSVAAGTTNDSSVSQSFTSNHSEHARPFLAWKIVAARRYVMAHNDVHGVHRCSAQGQTGLIEDCLHHVPPLLNPSAPADNDELLWLLSSALWWACDDAGMSWHAVCI